MQLTKAAQALDELATVAGVKNLRVFEQSVRSAITGLWRGLFDIGEFTDSMIAAVRTGYTRAWRQGARECGVQFDELTPQEIDTLNTRIFQQYLFIDGLATAIIANSQAAGGLKGPLIRRGDIWVSNYRAIQNEARIMACRDKKLIWRLGATEQHCPSCSKLDGQVRRASFWQERGIIARVNGATYLTCRGYHCDCTQLPTDLPVSRGPLPRLP